MEWDDLTFWSSGEWQVIQEKLDDLTFHPPPENMFAALDACPLEKTKVVIMGQDPYPDSTFATGVAFSIPKTATIFPPTLLNILKEYQDDLHYPMPTSGNLHRWCSQGVLLWNTVPVYMEQSLVPSHPFHEWTYLNQELVQCLDEKDVVFAFLGLKARAYAAGVSESTRCIETSHPSPLGASRGVRPFLGSRLFTKINDRLAHIGIDPINWRLA